MHFNEPQDLILSESPFDISNCEKLRLVLKYIKDIYPIQRRIMLTFREKQLNVSVHVKTQNTIESGSSLKDCRGQIHDGARNMNVAISGAPRRFLEII